MKLHSRLAAAAVLLALAPLARSAELDPVLRSLVTFHPGWITRTVTTHDPTGHNGDGHGHGVAREGDYEVLFHGKGEGRILRLWMTADHDKVASRYQELWIIIDGQTAFRGRPLDFFEGRGPWRSPLVMGWDESSGAFLSYVPFAYAHEAKILFRGNPQYYQVTYREGAGSSAGPNPEQLAAFLREDWATGSEARLGSAPELEVAGGHSLALATGPLTITRLALKVDPKALRHLSVRVGSQEPVPAAFFFGLGRLGDEGDESADGGGWVKLKTALNSFSPESGVLATRLPIPLGAGESLSLEAEGGSAPTAVHAVVESSEARAGTKLVTQYRDQLAPGTDTTMAFFESPGPTQLVSLVEEILDGPPGSRGFLEGDEMVRFDRMRYPLELGTGTEDYFNGGWYFMGPHANPLSGMPRFVVKEPEDGWSHARFELSLYRHHLADPMVGRAGMRFGFEAGETGSFTPVRYRTLALAYEFEAPRILQRLELPSRGDSVTSAVDAEHSEKPFTFRVDRNYGQTTRLRLKCPGDADGLLLTRTYDAATPQEGGVEVVSAGGAKRAAGGFYESYVNSERRYAQDELWIDLTPADCAGGRLSVELTGKSAGWNVGDLAATFYASGARATEFHAGEPRRIFDSADLPGGPFYVNDHTLVRAVDGRWHLFGIFNHEPFNSSIEREFVHAVSDGPSLEGVDSLRFAGTVLPYDARVGENHVWAPHVVPYRDSDGGLHYVMAFHSGFTDNDQSRITIARSDDLDHWQRLPEDAVFKDICVARDPMLVRLGATWAMYYTRCRDTRTHLSGVAVRTSQDLVHWSEPSMALVLPDSAMFNSGNTESPFVFERGGWFYLSVTSYPVDWNATRVFRSRSPFQFEPLEIGRLRSHAAEWGAFDGDFEGHELFFTHAGAGQGGVWLVPVEVR